MKRLPILSFALLSLLVATSVASAGERGAHPEESYAAERDDDSALGFGIQGEHFNGLPVDAGTIAGPKHGPAVKLDSEEATDAKDDNPDPALGDAGPSPLGMPDAGDTDQPAPDASGSGN